MSADLLLTLFNCEFSKSNLFVPPSDDRQSVVSAVIMSQPIAWISLKRLVLVDNVHFSFFSTRIFFFVFVSTEPYGRKHFKTLLLQKANFFFQMPPDFF